MSSMVQQTFGPLPLERFKSGSEGLETAGESDLENFKKAIGDALARAIQLAGWTQQEAAVAMGFESQTQLSSWIRGKETPQFARLWKVERLRQPLVIALAELAEGVEVITEIRIRRVV